MARAYTAFAAFLIGCLLAAGAANASVTARQAHHHHDELRDIPWNCATPTNETACLDLTGCYWNVFESKCQRICALVTTAEPCSTEPGCRWLPTPTPSGSTSNGTCTTACMFAYQEPTTCDAAVECRWDETVGGCVGSCAYYEELQPSQQLAQQLCEADTGCTWDGSAANKLQRCKPACRLAEIPEVCNSSAFAVECVWAPLIDMCVYRVSPPPEPTTTNAPTTLSPPVTETTTALPTTSAAPVTMPASCGFLSSETACEADPACQWNVQLSMCTRICSITVEPRTCNLNPSCIYRTSTGSCKKRCGMQYFSKSSCNDDAYCWWSEAEDQCVHMACDSFSSESVCDDPGDCQWDSSTSVCKPTCKYFEYAYLCLGTTGCDWNYHHEVCVNQETLPPETATAAPATSAAPTPPPTSRCRFVYTQKHCDAGPSCQWNPVYNKCYEACFLIADNITCNMNPSCVYCEGDCVKRCNVAYESRYDCDNAPTCSWSYANNVCQPEACDTFLNNRTGCLATGVCAWDPQYQGCAATCKFFTNDIACNRYEGCTWYSDGNVCVSNNLN